MERAEWLKRMQRITESLYDRFAWLYWGEWGLSEDSTHQAFLDKFLERVALMCGSQPGFILSAVCGAGRYDGLLLKAGHQVPGTISLPEKKNN